MSDRLSHLERLEAESIHIIREVAAECRNPVMLYSIGKDSSVMLHLARKAFFPAPPPFPLMHIDTTWKFREMIAFRDRMAAEAGMRLIVHTNQEGVKAGLNPFDHGPNYTRVMKTEALKQALDQHSSTRPSAARAATRRRAAPRSASSRSARRAMPGTRRTSGRSSGASTTRASTTANRCASSRCRIGPSSTSGPTSCARASRSCRSISRPSGRSSMRNGQLIMVDDDRLPLEPGETPRDAAGPLPHARLLSADRRGRIERHVAARRSSPR